MARGMPGPTLDEDGALQGGEKADDRPLRDLRLGHEAGVDHRADRRDVEIGDVVADEQHRPLDMLFAAKRRLDADEPAAGLVPAVRDDVGRLERKSVVWGKSLCVRLDRGGRRDIKTKNSKK